MILRLDDIFELQMGKTPSRNNEEYWQGNNKWVSISDIGNAGKFIISTKETISDKAVEESGIKAVPSNTLIMSFKLSIGKTTITTEQIYTNEAIMAFIDKKKYDIDISYLYHMFSSKDWSAGTNKAVMGLTLNKATLKQIEIDLPDISVQRNIAEKLDKLDTIINSTQKQLEKLDELVKSRFVEMFGDNDSNPYNWDIITVGQVIESIEAGWSGNGKQRPRKKGEIAVLKVSAVTKGYFIPDECKVLDDQNEIKKYVYPQKGDLLFSRANTRDMVGATAVIKKDYPELILSDKLWKIKFNSSANVDYMKQVLSTKSVRSIFSNESTGTSGSMYNVSMPKFKNVSIILPPIELQEQFASFVTATDKSKFEIQKSLEKLETLKKALMQEYFG